MKTNFKKFMAMMLAVLMVFGTFSSMVTAIDQDTCDHEWALYGGSIEEAKVERTCTTDGYTWIICIHCNKRDIKDIVKAPGQHDMVKDESSYDPTCQSEGLEVYKCQNEWCDYETSAVLPVDKDAHHFEQVWDADAKIGRAHV